MSIRESPILKPLSDARVIRMHVLLLVLLTGLAYCRVTDNGFIGAFDDGKYILENAHVKAGLTLHGIAWAFTTTHASNWHPVTWISHMLDCQLYGLKAAGHHLTNLALHMANSILLYLLLIWMTGRPRRSLFVAALFAIHPLHVESVAWIAERKDVLSTFFLLLTIAAYLRYVARPVARRYVLVLLAFALGLLSKPMLVSLPVILLLLDFWPLERLSKLPMRRLILEKLPLMIMAAASCAVTLVAQQHAMRPMRLFGPANRAENAAVSYVSYILKMLWPKDLSFFYPHPITIPAWQAVVSVVLIAAALVVAIRCVRSKPYLIVGLLWYLVALLPAIGLVQAGMQAFADRYTYVPLVGIFIMIAWGISDLIAGRIGAERGSRVLIAAFACVVIALAARTCVQTGYWLDSEALFKRAIEIMPTNYLARYNLGCVYQEQERWPEAEREFRIGTTIIPDLPNAHVNLAIVLLREHRYQEAEAAYRALLRAHLEVADSREGLAMALGGEGKTDRAIALYKDCIRRKPREPRLHMELGSLYMNSGALNAAASEIQIAIKLDPGNVSAHHNLGWIYQRQRHLDLALREYRAAVDLAPKDARNHQTLAVLLYAVGEYPASWAELQQVERLGKQPDPELVQRLREEMGRK